jgi:hypothetical protein
MHAFICQEEMLLFNFKCFYSVSYDILDEYIGNSEGSGWNLFP